MPVRTYVHLWDASEFVFGVGAKEPKGCSYHYLSSIILAAFAIEAYLNHIGEKILKSWKEVEKSLSPMGKYSLICDVLDVKKLDAGELPLSTIIELYKFRNLIAHGKTEILTEKKEIVSEGLEYGMYGEFLKSNWQKKLNDSTFAGRVIRDGECFIRHIHEAHGDDDDLVFSHGIGSDSAKIIEDLPGHPASAWK